MFVNSSALLLQDCRNSRLLRLDLVDGQVIVNQLETEGELITAYCYRGGDEITCVGPNGAFRISMDGRRQGLNDSFNGSEVWFLACSDNWIAAGLKDQGLELWRSGFTAFEKRLSAYGSVPSAICWLNSGNTLAFQSGRSEVTLFDTQSMTERTILFGNDESIMCLASVGNESLCIASRESIELHNINSRSGRVVLEMIDHMVIEIAVSPDGKLLAVSGLGRLTIGDIESNTILASKVVLGQGTGSLVFDKSGSLLCLIGYGISFTDGDEPPTVLVFDLTKLRERLR